MSSGDEAAAPKPAAAAKPMSRFLRSAGDDSSDESESESEEESEMSSDEEEKPKRSRFLKTGSDDDSSDEDEGKRRRAQRFKLPKAIRIGFGRRASRES